MLSKKNLDADFIVLANDARAGSDEISGRLGGLDLEHDWHLTLVNESDVRFRSVFTSRCEADMGDRIQSDKLAPVFCLLLLRRRAKRCLRRHLSLIYYLY